MELGFHVQQVKMPIYTKKGLIGWPVRTWAMGRIGFGNRQLDASPPARSDAAIAM